MWPFECKHIFSDLHIEKDSTVEIVDKDFASVTHHFICRNCMKKIDKKYSTFIRGVEFFMRKKG